MQIKIETIEHKNQRYPTVGDWYQDSEGVLHIKVSDMGNDDFNLLVAIHELVEASLCIRNGVKEEDVTNFDQRFELMRRDYPDLVGDREPGNAHTSPYKKEHVFATSIEARVAKQLGVKWDEYDTAVNSL